LGTHEYTEDEKDILAVLRDRYPMFRDDKIYKFMVARDLDMVFLFFKFNFFIFLFYDHVSIVYKRMKFISFFKKNNIKETN